jgi:hypothetical protein
MYWGNYTVYFYPNLDNNVEATGSRPWKNFQNNSLLQFYRGFDINNKFPVSMGLFCFGFLIHIQ